MRYHRVMSSDAPSSRAKPPETPADMLAQLRSLLSAFPGTQRELLAVLDAEWIPRLLAHGPGERAIAAALIRKKIKSNKLGAQLEACVEKLFFEP